MQDLVDNTSYTPVKSFQGQEMRREIGAIKYLECSSLTQKGVNEIFEEAARAGIQPPQKVKKKRTKSKTCKCVLV